VKAFEAATGVQPVYGGKHPGGTHNALVSEPAAGSRTTPTGSTLSWQSFALNQNSPKCRLI
jgi:hypothetical protein